MLGQVLRQALGLVAEARRLPKLGTPLASAFLLVLKVQPGAQDAPLPLQLLLPLLLPMGLLTRRQIRPGVRAMQRAWRRVGRKALHRQPPKQAAAVSAAAGRRLPAAWA